MTPEREHLLIQYLDKAILRDATSARHIRALIQFLNEAPELTAKAYRKYRKNYSNRFLNNESKYIIGFLKFNNINVGYPRIHKDSANTNELKPKKTLLIDESEIGNFLHWLESRYDYSINTLKIYEVGIRLFFCFSKCFNNDNVREYARYLEKSGYSPQTINTRLVALKLYAKYKKSNVVIKNPKIPRKLSCENIPTESEYKQLLGYLIQKDDKKFYLWVRILATTGLRLSEFMSLKWSDVILGEITLRGKGNKYRTIFFQKQLINECKQYIPESKRSYPVVYAKGTDRLASDRVVLENMVRWAKDTGINKKKLHPHAFRHFFAKQYLKTKNSPMQLAELLGHSSMDTTMLYIQKNKEEQKRDFNKSVTW